MPSSNNCTAPSELTCWDEETADKMFNAVQYARAAVVYRIGELRRKRHTSFPSETFRQNQIGIVQDYLDALEVLSEKIGRAYSLGGH